MTQQIINLKISPPGAASGAANMKPTKSIAFSRGRQSLDRSVWYNGWLMTFLATGEETQGQFALIEAVGKRGNVPPPHIHHREDEIFYVLEAESVVSVVSHNQGKRPEQWSSYRAMCATRSRSNRNSSGYSSCSLPPGWKDGSRNSVFRHQP